MFFFLSNLADLIISFDVKSYVVVVVVVFVFLGGAFVSSVICLFFCFLFFFQSLDMRRIVAAFVTGFDKTIV